MLETVAGADFGKIGEPDMDIRLAPATDCQWAVKMTRRFGVSISPAKIYSGGEPTQDAARSIDAAPSSKNLAKNGQTLVKCCVITFKLL